MTAIVAVQHAGKVWMGADSASTSGGSAGMYIRSDKKIFENNGMLIGSSNSHLLAQLLEYHLKLAADPSDWDDLMGYMVTQFVPELRKLHRDNGLNDVRNGQEVTAGEILVAIRGELFCICFDYQVEVLIEPFNAIGCGKELAIGSLATTAAICDQMEEKMPPKDRIEIALEVCERHNAGVRRPFHILST